MLNQLDAVFNFMLNLVLIPVRQFWRKRFKGINAFIASFFKLFNLATGEQAILRRQHYALGICQAFTRTFVLHARQVNQTNLGDIHLTEFGVSIGIEMMMEGVD